MQKITICKMIYERLSDRELWSHCRKDDMFAYNTLFRRYAPKLYIQAVRYLPNTTEAEELVMDLLLNLWQKRDSLEIAGELKAYLFRAIHNRVINHLQKRIPETQSIDLLEEDELIESRQADYRILTGDLEMSYRDKLENLSPQRRKVFLLSREENMSYAQIAQLLNLSVNTVENHMTSALNALRESTRELTTLSLLLCIGNYFL